MSEKFPGHGIVRTNRRARIGGSNPIFREKIRPENVPPKILTLLDAFDEILTLLGPCVPTKSGFWPNHYRTPRFSRNLYPILWHGSDFIYTTMSARPGSGFYLHKELARPGSGFYLHKLYISKNFPAARA